MPTSRLLVAVVGLLIALPSWGQDAEQAPRRRPQPPAFQFLFSIRGVAFSDEQRAQVEKLRKKYTPQLIEVQRQQASVLTDEQRRARQQVFRAAREAGKSGQEARELVDAALKLTDEQQKQVAAAQREQAELFAEIQGEVRALLTQSQQAQLRGGQRDRNAGGGPARAPTHRDLSYGPHRRNVMDVWLAESEKPTPVLVSIHGGGFRGGNKSVSGGILSACLNSGISVVAITYRLSDEAIAPAQFLDAARAIQFIRHHASEWNIDPAQLAATGGSAGAGISLWLGFHDDLADPNSSDPVLRQSTRLTCMAVYNGQTSYDPRFIRELFPDTNTYQESALAQLFDVDLKQLDSLPQEKYRLFEEVSALPHLSEEDPPALLMYANHLDTEITSQGIGIHHPRFGQALKEKMDQLGIESRVETGVRRGDESFTTLTMEFVTRHFAPDPIVEE